ncbi:bacillithiol biosynthesis cysteine-adding enzyme BshC [Flammeovirga kamogawensis]|uniref:Putative cysteine ligase BshC n=1 Tax=Flammeovirga kamogawensis TaxID=373891 RepID=A0ABX8GUL4_9BACT|nr:bacillithiol biosynthesis cysteine-adding enzyme BshC [Flammeovirga kamogawensis]MBB6459647.1 bacillithiol biosynthesis cysteine-adding enzyme BshC [Flammeovirga kamogawensis]QWG07290.1 bacillithiol biosynthesis cysteine-adding enzyme BshC [Flammeovirga kamogawensis]TRX69107.1 bacillithiol biosynthesis cysteine-adding enzyme BshC [Flammeovirga kamogawensis]
MNTYKIPFETAGLYGKMFLDYLNGNDALKSLYQFEPNLSSFDKIIDLRKSFPKQKRTLLVDSLKKQYSEIEDAPIAQIELLEKENTFTVVTGHQLNIFTGPLFFIYKIAATIHLTQQLKEKYPDCNFIPVYWMATEDHDFEEIASFKLSGKKYTWEHPEATGPVGRLSLEGIDKILDQIKDMPQFFVDAYTDNKTLTEATRSYVNHLFSRYGLVCFDADHVELKSSFKEILIKELFDNTAVEKVEKANTIIESAGYKTQIHARAINLFYMEDKVRLRLEKTSKGFKTVDGDYSWTDSEMRDIVENNPERLSPNVVLRPVLQEFLLPNLAYLGGPAEVIYWLQLKGVFDAYNVFYPMVLPRGFSLLLDAKYSVKWRKMGWPLEELLQPVATIENKLLDEREELETSLEAEIKQFDSLYASILEKGKAITPNLEKHVLAEKLRGEKRLKHTADKLRKEGKRKIKEDIERVVCIRECLLPSNVPQERVENLLSFWSKSKGDLLLDTFVKELDPLAFKLNIIVED